MIKRKIISALLAVSVGYAMLSALPANAEGFSIKGDVNADGEFDVADVVLLQPRRSWARCRSLRRTLPRLALFLILT